MSISNLAASFLALMASLVTPVAAQTTSFTATFTTTNHQSIESLVRSFQGTGAVGGLGNTVVVLNLNYVLSEQDYVTGIGPVAPVLTIWPNRPDSIVINPGAGQNVVQDPNFSTATLSVGANGTGTYAGLTASGLTLTLTRTSTSPLRFNVSLRGSVTVAGRTTDLAMANVPVSQTITQINVFDRDTGTCSMPPLGDGNLTMTIRPDSNRWDDKVKFVELGIVCSLSPTDSFRIFSIVDIDPTTDRATPRSSDLGGGMGKFLGATGTAQIVNIEQLSGDLLRITVNGTITQASATTPIVGVVNTASGLAGNGIAQNDWIEIKGMNLVPKNTPAGGMYWSNAPEFAQGKMPTQLGGVSVTVNDKPAYVWWFCSAATTPACIGDQINVLTPLDDYTHQVKVVVKNGADSSSPFIVTKVETTPSILLLSTRGDAVATHPDGSIVGPASLYPGASTPARRSETISVWGVGFGLPTTPLAAGSSTQAGSLPYTPACYFGGTQTQVAAALVSPGLYQFNVTIPENAASGDNPFYCTIPNNWTLPAVIAVQ